MLHTHAHIKTYKDIYKHIHRQTYKHTQMHTHIGTHITHGFITAPELLIRPLTRILKGSREAWGRAAFLCCEVGSLVRGPYSVVKRGSGGIAPT